LPYESSDRTDAKRAFRIVTIPGPVLLMAKTEGMSRFVYKSTGPDPKYPQYFRKHDDFSRIGKSVENFVAYDATRNAEMIPALRSLLLFTSRIKRRIASKSGRVGFHPGTLVLISTGDRLRSS